ncbi:MAG: GNAT family N-acetyltransferase [Thermodesulfobacteriota bacterium]
MVTDIAPTDFQTCIRSATDSDLPRIMEIDKLSFTSSWDDANFKAALRDIFLVFEEKEIIGFLIACYCQLANKAVIMKIAVHPEHRGKGIGSKLIKAALKEFTLIDVKDVELDVDVVKNGAIRLYEKFGFKCMQVVTMDCEEDDSFYMMKLRLGKT